MKKTSVDNIEEKKIYSEVDEYDKPNDTKSCFYLFLLCITIYAVILFLIWQAVPWLRRVQLKAMDIKDNINLNTSQDLTNITKDKLKDTVDQTKEKAKDNLKNQVNETRDSLINSTKEQLEEVTNN